ncbi:MAG: thioredoxin domain-containing protein [Planctomycetaceae bacterium]|nr:thioredoxin domain-containing protein [Planctomycetaceae bacterium]
MLHANLPKQVDPGDNPAVLSRWLICFLVCCVLIGLNGCTPKTSDQEASDAASQASDAASQASDAASQASDAASQASDAASQASDAASQANDATSEAESPTQQVNRLVDETSPYLRMHAHNPVDWYPWGEEALKKAKDENKLIFLSVGYSSCHWCHVMERESFMDKEIAKILNDNFVCIKVDREERPDVDTIYMMAVQLLTRRGGWPMSVFLTPDAEPFFGGTYFPARSGDRPGAIGFLSILERIQELWKTKPQDVSRSAADLTRAIQQELQGQPILVPFKLSAELLDRQNEGITTQFDPEFGGFGFDPNDAQRPKFPEPSNLVFLLDRWQNSDDESAKKMALSTLDHMARGGIWDHLGGGFHRYSVDRSWQIPHFEKMLYDNGQLLSVYSNAYKLTGDENLKWIVDDTVAYMLRDARDPGGAFYAAMDADSENVEGKYYRWEIDEVKELLGEDFEFFASVYGLDGAPNFEEHFYVLQLPQSFAEIASEKNLSPQELRDKLRPMQQKLLAVRAKRVPPLTDSKILCSWNGLAIRGLADAGRNCDNPAYVDAAVQAAEFILANLRDENGNLLRTYSSGKAKLNAYLDDYAFLIDGLIALHQATGDVRWLNQADALMQLQIDGFWDDSAGGFFFTANDHEKLIARSKQVTDGARPAGNSISAANLIYLGVHLDKADYLEKARETARNTALVMERVPTIAPRMAVVIDSIIDSMILVGDENAEGAPEADVPLPSADPPAEENVAPADASSDDRPADPLSLDDPAENQ